MAPNQKEHAGERSNFNSACAALFQFMVTGNVLQAERSIPLFHTANITLAVRRITLPKRTGLATLAMLGKRTLALPACEETEAAAITSQSTALDPNNHPALLKSARGSLP